MIDPAFLDRLHFYLPGWEAPKLEQRLFTDHFGFVSDYFAEALRQLRKHRLTSAPSTPTSPSARISSARDERAVRKTVSGLAEDPPPARRVEPRRPARVPGVRHGRPPPGQGAAQEARAHDYAKTAFSYIENDTGREVWVEVPEQPDVAVVETIQSEERLIPRPPRKGKSRPFWGVSP